MCLCEREEEQLRKCVCVCGGGEGGGRGGGVYLQVSVCDRLSAVMQSGHSLADIHKHLQDLRL